MGGRVVSCGKLDGTLEALQFDGLAPRDVLLVTHQLGDVVEAPLGGGKVMPWWNSIAVVA